MNTFLRDMDLDMNEAHVRCIAGLACCNPNHAGPMIDDSNWQGLGAVYALELLEAAADDAKYGPAAQQVIRGAMYNIEARAQHNMDDVWDFLDARRLRQVAAVKVGDVVCFKSDYEQCGKVTEIRGTGGQREFVLENENGFGGEYLRYATTTVEPASRCWID